MHIAIVAALYHRDTVADQTEVIRSINSSLITKSPHCPVFDYLHSVFTYTLLKFCKDLLGVPLSATTAAVLGELGRFPIWMTTQLCVINYWMRSKLGKAPVLVQEAVKLSEAMSTLRFDSWFMKMRNIISKLGFACVRPTRSP